VRAERLLRREVAPAISDLTDVELLSSRSHLELARSS